MPRGPQCKTEGRAYYALYLVRMPPYNTVGKLICAERGAMAAQRTGHSLSHRGGNRTTDEGCSGRPFKDTQGFAEVG